MMPIDHGSALFLVRRQAERERLLQTAGGWGTEKSTRDLHQLSPLGPEGQWFRCQGISRVGGHWPGFVAAMAHRSPGGATPGWAVLPSGTATADRRSAGAAVGLWVIGKRPYAKL